MNSTNSTNATNSTDSFVQLIIDAAESHRGKMAMDIIGVEGTRYTFAEMLDAIRSVAFRLEKEGVGLGERVALIGENHPRWAIAYFGILYRGAVCVPIDPHGEIATITNFIENSEAKMAFVGKDFIKNFHKLEENLHRKIPAVVLHDVKDELRNKEMSAVQNPQSKIQSANSEQTTQNENPKSTGDFQSFSDWARTPRPKEFDLKSPPAKPEDLAVLIYTSGTTGTPKGVPLTHGNIFYETRGCQEVMNVSETEVVLSVLPLFHVFAQVINLWVIASIGASVYYIKELAPAELDKAFKTGEITMLTGVPRLWYLFHKKIFDGIAALPFPVRWLLGKLLKFNGFLRDTFNVNLGRTIFGKVHKGFGGNLDITISAGSRFDEKIARDYYELGFTIIQGYGLTETCGAVASTRFEGSSVGSVGKAVNYAEIKLGEPNDDGAGEVLIRGRMVFSGYYKNPEATKDAFTEDGWFKSGDLGKFDENGDLFIVGRSKDVIVLPNGKNIHPEDLEVQYSKTPLVEEICILGVKDESSALAGAEKLIAIAVPDFTYLKQNNIANSREAIRHELDNLGRRLPEYQRVRDYVVRSEPLPRTATRKIKRFELQKEIEENGYDTKSAPDKKQWIFTDEESAMLESNVGRALVKAIKQNTKEVDKIHPGMNLEIDLGLDSLSRAEVFASLEQAFNIEFDSDRAGNALTVGEVIKLTGEMTGDADAEVVSTDFNWGKIVRESSDNLPEVQDILRARPIFSPVAYAFFQTVGLISKVLFKLEVTGGEQLDRLKRPYLICPNHQSFLDPFVLSSTYSYEVLNNSFVVGASMFFQSGFMRFVARMMNVVAIDPDTQLLKAIKASATGLKHGKILNIFPEGERGFDGDLHEFKKGAAILATELDLPIVPVAIDGLYKVWGRSSNKINLSKVKIRFGAPFYPREIIGEEMDDEAKYQVVTAHLKGTIAAMIAEMRSSEKRPKPADL
ncbi:MAG: AMP-binding protein [Acidobacteriota bacterium]|nr:AMP-binding protein [Acidobacteriota bacterium]